MAAPGVYAELAGARKEPMLSASCMAQDLKNVVLGRLDILRLRHESMGGNGPALEKMGQTLARMQRNGRHPVWDSRGVLEDHKRRTRPLADAALQRIGAGGKQQGLDSILAVLSHRFEAVCSGRAATGTSAKTIEDGH